MAKKNRYFVKKEQPVKPQKCSACNGTGYYDNTNSPTCSSCNGTGLE